MSALNMEEASQSLFGNIKRKAQHLPEPKPHENISSEEDQQETPLAKWKSLDRVTVLLTTEQKEGLDKIAKSIMKYRSRSSIAITDRERITANTILRALIDNFLENEAKLSKKVLNSEEDVKSWVMELFSH